jgi:polar amino acid transport system substrate-binding protein
MLLVFFLFLPSYLSAQPATGSSDKPASEHGKLLVAAAPCPPFVIKESGNFTGLGVYLWDQVAKQMGVQYEFTEHTLHGMLTAISGGLKASRPADVGISCLSITAEREKVIDFSHSFHETYTGIAVKQRTVTDIVKGFFTNPAIWRALGIVLGVAVLIGGIFYLLEHKINPKLYSMQGSGGKLSEALLVGLLFVTQGPIKFYEFKTMSARLIAAILTFGSTFLIAGITAILASAFTLNGLRSDLTSLQDLNRVRVAALEASTSSEFLSNNGIAHQTRTDLDQMMTDLEYGRLDAVVSDAAFLKYSIRKGREAGRYESLFVLPYELDSQNYGFAMQRKSRLDEDVNQALLVVRKTPEWRNKLREYLGE